MKYQILIYSLLCCFLFVETPAVNGQASVKAFYKEHKRKKGVINFKIPGWLMWLGAGMAYNSVDDPEMRHALKLARRIGTLRIMFSEGGLPIENGEISSFVSNIRQKDFEELVIVRDDGTEVTVIGRNKRNKLKDLVFLVNDDGEFVFVSFKSNIRTKDLSKLLNYLLKEEASPLDKMSAKEKRREKRKKRKDRKKKEKPKLIQA